MAICITLTAITLGICTSMESPREGAASPPVTATGESTDPKPVQPSETGTPTSGTSPILVDPPVVEPQPPVGTTVAGGGAAQGAAKAGCDNKLATDDNTCTPLTSVTADQLNSSPDEVLFSLSSAEIAKIPAIVLVETNPDKLDALARVPGAVEGTSDAARFLRDRLLDPRVSLVGDAFGQVTTAGANGDGLGSSPGAGATTEGAFGGGIEIETLTTRSFFLIRKGTSPRILEKTEDFGSSLLFPQTENVSFEASQALMAEIKWKDRASHLLGGYFHGAAATTVWRLTASGNVTDPTGAEMTRQEIAESRVWSFMGSLGIQYSWLVLAEKKLNRVEITPFLGVSLRGVTADKGANRRIEEISEIFPVQGSHNFVTRAIDTKTRVFPGMDLGVALRINQVVIAATLPYVAGDVPGLSGFRFVPMLNVRTGATLASLANPNPLQRTKRSERKLGKPSIEQQQAQQAQSP